MDIHLCLACWNCDACNSDAGNTYSSIQQAWINAYYVLGIFPNTEKQERKRFSTCSEVFTDFEGNWCRGKCDEKLGTKVMWKALLSLLRQLCLNSAEQRSDFATIVTLQVALGSQIVSEHNWTEKRILFKTKNWGSGKLSTD